jgi:hypothetical protein
MLLEAGLGGEVAEQGRRAVRSKARTLEGAIAAAAGSAVPSPLRAAAHSAPAAWPAGPTRQRPTSPAGSSDGGEAGGGTALGVDEARQVQLGHSGGAFHLDHSEEGSGEIRMLGAGHPTAGGEGRRRNGGKGSQAEVGLAGAGASLGEGSAWMGDIETLCPRVWDIRDLSQEPPVRAAGAS